MPVTFSDLNPDYPTPRPPLIRRWALLFAALVAVGVIAGLALAPAQPAQRDTWFWIQLAGAPVLLWCVLFALRRHYYDAGVALHKSEAAARARDHQEALAFGRDPLALLSWYYICGENGSNSGKVSEHIVKADTMLTAQPVREGGASLRHSRIDQFAAGEEWSEGGLTSRYRDAFGASLSALSARLQDLPRDVPFQVWLQLPDDADRPTLAMAWRACWQSMKLRPTEAILMSPGTGLMALDDWLDARGGPELKKVVLIVAVQLHETPSEGNSESVVALMFSWEPLASRRRLGAQAWLHRPVEAQTGEIAAAADLALCWAEISPGDVADLWFTGLPQGVEGDLMAWVTKARCAVAGSGGKHDVDMALGYADAAAEWLLLALAAERCAEANAPQLIATHEARTRMAVLRCVPDRNGLGAVA